MTFLLPRPNETQQEGSHHRLGRCCCLSKLHEEVADAILVILLVLIISILCMHYILFLPHVFRNDKKPGDKGGEPPRASPPPSADQQPPQTQKNVDESSKSDEVTVTVSQILSSSPSAAAEIVEKYLAESNNEPQGESLLVESQSSMEGCDETESLEAKYYHIDTLVNKVMRLKFELNQTSLKRQETIRNLEKAKERLNFLNRPNPSSLILVEAFHKETLENYRRLLSRIKAIDESLVNLQRQYDDTLCQAENEKRNFLKTRQSDSELLPEVEIPIQSKVSKYSTFSPSQLLTRDRWTQIGDNTNTDSSDTEHGDLTTEMDSKKEEESVRISLEEAEGRLFDWTKSFELEIPQTILDQCTLDRCSVCGVSHSTLENALRHYNSKRHKKAIQKLLKLKTENDRYVYIKPPRNQHDSYKRMSSLDNKEAEMRELWEKHTDAEYRVDRPWLTEDVTKFVSQSVQDFQTLLKWLEDLQSEEKWDSWKINDITYGLGKLLLSSNELNINNIFRENSLKPCK